MAVATKTKKPKTWTPAMTVELMRSASVAFAMVLSRGRWTEYKHLIYLARKVEECIEKPGGRLIIQIPPRHGKTEYCAIYLPAWYLKNNPDKYVMYVTYSAEQAYKISRRARQVYSECDYGEGLSGESSSVSVWNTAGLLGGYQAAGIGGPITGSGADLMIIDDPYKNQEEASSVSHRNKVMEYWEWTLSTRLEPSGSVILIQTRWHHDDIAGVLGRNPEWKTISLPAIALENDGLGRDQGQALCPARYNEDDLELIRKAVSSYVWQALYQQQPTPSTGNRFKSDHYRYFLIDKRGDYILNGKRVQPKIIKIYQFIDTAGTESAKSDYFVSITIGLTPDKQILILDIFRERAETTRHEQILKQQREKWRPEFQAVEKKVFGINLIQSAKKNGAPLKPLEAKGDKWTRSEQAVVFYENGMIWHPARAPWLADYEAELAQFPKGEHDDMVDCISYAAIYVKANSGKSLLERY